MRASRILVIGLCWLLGNAILSVPAARGAETLDLEYVSGDAIGSMVIFPRRLLTDPKFDLLPHEIVVAACQENLGIDPREIESALLVVGLGRLPDGPPGFGFILHFRKPYDQRSLVKLMGPRAVESDHQGKKYWKLADGSPEPVCIATPSERLLLVGSEPQLQSMFAAKNVDSGLTKLLKKADSSKELILVMDFEAVRPMVLKAMEGMPPVPPPMRPMLEMPKLMKSVEFSLGLDPFSVDLAVGANNDADAKKIKGILEGFKTLARMMIEQQVASMGSLMGDQGSSVARATSQYMRRLSKAQIDSIEVLVEAEKVHIGVKTSVAPYVMVAGVGTALLLPAVQAAREAARRTVGSNSLKLIGLALHNYHSVHGHFPARAIYDKAGRPMLSWRVAILPYLDEEKLYKEFHLEEPWDSAHNRKLIDRMPRLFLNPNAPEPGKTIYLAVEGKGTVFGGLKGASIRDIRDGTSNTGIVVEANADRAVPWTRPEDLEFNPDHPLAGLGQLRPNGFSLLFADGSVHFIANSVDANVLRGMMTMDGREAIGLQ